MIVYLQKVYAGEYPQQQYPQQPEKKESHWVRNGLLTTGALVGAHFGAKAGLLGRHMQKFAGNMHTKMGNALGWREMAASGRRSAGTAQAMMENNVTGRGNAAWEEAFKKANPNQSLEGLTDEAKDKILGKFRAQQIGTAMKSGEGVEQIKGSLLKEDSIRNVMDHANNGGNTAVTGITKDMKYEDAAKAFDDSTFGKSFNGKFGVTPPPPAQ